MGKMEMDCYTGSFILADKVTENNWLTLVGFQNIGGIIGLGLNDTDTDGFW